MKKFIVLPLALALATLGVAPAKATVFSDDFEGVPGYYDANATSTFNTWTVETGSVDVGFGFTSSTNSTEIGRAHV